jgi:hypothetical protein
MDDVSAKLTVFFQVTNDWLKFAEAKNAILIAFSGAGTTAAVTLLATTQKIPNSLRIGLSTTAALLCTCVLFCSLSFLPQTNVEGVLSWKKKPCRNSVIQPEYDNFYFFGHLKKYNRDILLDSLNKYYFEGKIDVKNKEYQHLAEQITINARIASLKLKYFTRALYILIFSILIIPLSMLISLILYHKF